MSWIKLDDKFHRNAKVLAMSDAAHRVYVDALSFCGDVDEPTGYLSEEQARSFLKSRAKPPKVVEELVGLNAWERVAGGFLIHDFEKYLPKTSTQRVRDWRERKRQEAVTETPVKRARNVSETPRNGSTHARARATTGLSPSTTSPDVPVPEPVPVPDNPSQSPSLLAARVRDVVQNGHHEDLGLLVATRLADLIELAQPSAQDVNIASYFIDDFAYLSVDDMVEDGRQHVEYCKANGLPLPRSIHGFRPTLVQANGKRCDAGAAKAWRPDPVLGDLSKLATPEPDLDE